MMVVVGEEAVKPSLLSTTRSDAWQKTRGVDDADIIPLQQSLMGATAPSHLCVFLCKVILGFRCNLCELLRTRLAVLVIEKTW